jgi:hypothetical protein
MFCCGDVVVTVGACFANEDGTPVDLHQRDDVTVQYAV